MKETERLKKAKGCELRSYQSSFSELSWSEVN